jgi:hypothetical protein
MNQQSKNFLVRMGEAMFFAGFDKKWKPLGVATPSTAQHMKYEKADMVCQHLISIGYQNVCVTDRIGRPADLEIIHAELNSKVS